MKPVRILIENTTMNLGGAESLIMNIYRKIDRDRLQFDFILHCKEKSAFEDEILSLGGIVYKFPVFKVFNIISYRRAFRNFFKAHRDYKVIHGHAMNTAAIYLDEANKAGLHTIAHSHNTSNGKGPSAWIRDYFRRNLYKIAEYRLACSEEAGKWLFRNKVSFKVIKNGINTDNYIFNSASRKIIRDEFHISDSTIVLGNVGNLITSKNHSFLLEVFSQFVKKNKDSILLLIGSGPLRKDLEEKAIKLGIRKQVILTGARRDVNELLNAMDYFVFPSLFEGLPVTLVEAQCNGLPCIISDIISDEVIITDLVSKLPLKSGPDAWSEAIYQTPVSERKNMSEAIRSAGYDISETAKELQEFYLNLNS